MEYVNTMEEDILEQIIDKIEEVEEIPDNPNDLTFELWSEENKSGSITYNRYKAIEWIKDNFEELGEVVEQYREETGITLNPFKDPECFMVVIFIEVTNNILSELWKDGITKEEIINKLNNWE